MRILFLDQFSQLGGAQLCLRDVLLEAGRRGWKAEVMAPGRGPLLSFAQECGFAARSLRGTGYTNGRKTASDVLRFGMDMAQNSQILRTALSERPADLIYVNGPRMLPAVYGLRTPVLFHSHSLLDKRYARMVAGLVLRGNRSRVLACSKFTGRPLQSLLGADRVRVLYNGVSDQGFCPRDPGAGPVRVGILGRIAPEKGHRDFLRAAMAIRDREKVQFCITGAALFSDAGYEQSIRAAAADIGVETRGWTGNVSEALHNMDILAVPSASHDASPRVILEALSAGTGVVSYPSGGIPEILRDGYNGLLTRTPSPEEFAAKISTLIADPGLRNRIAANGRREWEARFRVERFRREVCDGISEMVTSPAPFASGSRSTSQAQAFARGERLSGP